MKGIVDDELRALVEVVVGASGGSVDQPLQVWVDTGFNGGLVIPRSEIERLGMPEYSSTRAILADGKQVDMPTYTCHIEWFGHVYRTQVVANDGAYPLLGTMLLSGSRSSDQLQAKDVNTRIASTNIGRARKFGFDGVVCN